VVNGQLKRQGFYERCTFVSPVGSLVSYLFFLSSIEILEAEAKVRFVSTGLVFLFFLIFQFFDDFVV